MALVRNQIDALYGGVNQQSAEQRLSTQVEEMINAYPTLDRGLLKRNPTKKITLDSSIVYSNDMFQYSYDRGDSNAEDENYSIQITSTGIDIIDTVSGSVKKEGSGLTYDGTSKSYITTNFGGKNGYACLTIKDTTFIVNKNIKPQMLSTLFPTATSKLKSFFWIKSGEPNVGYSYTYKLTNTTGTKTATVTATNSVAVATALTSSINAGGGGFTATQNGSVVKVVSTSTITVCEMTDTFGNQASVGFVDEVNVLADVPATLGFEDTVIKILGTAGTKVPYYVIYKNGLWKETMSGSVKYLINRTTMPHILVRNSDGTFTLKQYAEWKDREVGDDTVTPIPSIFLDNNVIKDIFFIKNRLGFITETTVVLSEIAKYGNFFRTTALSILDSDAIDISINSTKSIILEYAVNMEDSLMITSDKLQFRLKEVDVLTPNTIAFIPSSSYEISRDVRPLFMNNRVFFVVKRGDYSAVIEFYISSTTNTIAGDDITAHVQNYIEGDIDRLAGSSINNMLFLSKSGTSTIYIYKFYDSGKDRVQSAWFKWRFNGNIYGNFIIGKKLIVLISRLSSNVESGFVVSDGTWNNDKHWIDTGIWNMTNVGIDRINQVETIDIFPQEYTGLFLDNDDTVINVDVLLGEWVVSMNGTKDVGSIVKFKTVQIESEPNSKFNLYIMDTNRNTVRKVAEKYTVKRKPMVFGDTKNIKIGIENNSNYGFRINSIAYEGELNSRSRRI